MIWNLKDLYNHCNAVHTEVDGQWVPARPISPSILQRVKAAIAVLKGSADAFTWTKGQ